MGDITISRAGPDDIEQGSGFWLARSRTGVSPLCGENQRNDGAVVGCIALRPLDIFPASGEVKRLYVQPASRGLGIAGLLLDVLHEYARAVGYEWLYLDSKDDLEAALRFYEKRGYRRCARYNAPDHDPAAPRTCPVDRLPRTNHRIMVATRR